MTEVPRTSRSRAVTPRLRRILRWVLIGFGLMVIDSLYLLGVRWLDWLESGGSDTLLSIWAFLLHVILGLILVVPVIVYGVGHMRRARHSHNHNARRVGYVLFLAALVLLVSGVLLLGSGAGAQQRESRGGGDGEGVAQRGDGEEAVGLTRAK